MNQIFNPDNFFWKCFDKMADVLGLSLLWFVCSLPLVTVGAASTALYDAAVHCVRGGERTPYSRFLRTFKAEFKPATLCWLVWGGVLLLPFAISNILANNAGDSGTLALLSVVYYVLMVVPGGMLCWLFPLLSRFRYSLGGLNRTAVQFWFAHLPSTVAMAALLGLCVDLCVQLLLPVCCLPCLLALAHSFFVERAFRKHLLGPKPGEEAEHREQPE